MLDTAIIAFSSTPTAFNTAAAKNDVVLVVQITRCDYGRCLKLAALPLVIVAVTLATTALGLTVVIIVVRARQALMNLSSSCSCHPLRATFDAINQSPANERNNIPDDPRAQCTQ